MRQDTQMQRYRIYGISLLSVATLSASAFFGGASGCGGSGSAPPTPINIASTAPGGGGSEPATETGTVTVTADGIGTATATGSPDVTAPTVSSTDPIDVATAVAINQKIVATFSEEMDSLTITTSRFEVTGPGVTPVAGAVTYALTGNTATFTPDVTLAASTLYTVTILTGAKDIAGNALASNFVWSFTTGVEADIIAPTVTAMLPADAATGVVLNQTIAATFSEAMSASTITTANYILTGPGAVAIAGSVDYNLLNNIATFTPGSDLTSDTLYTATITTGVQDLAGNALLASKVWSFTTGSVAAAGPAAVNLLSIATHDFVILAKDAITDANLGSITGNIGLSPAAGSFIFVSCAEMHGTGLIYEVDAAYEVTGFAACAMPGTSGGGENKTLVDTAVADMLTAYTAASDPATPAGVGASNLNVGAGTLTGNNFIPGTYTWGSDVNITDNITITGNANDVWIFQMSGNLSIASGKQVILGGAAKASNIFWQVGGGTGATLGTTSTFNGTILSATQVIIQSGAVLHGRALANTQVTLDANTVGP